MRDFDYEVLQRKRLANQARYRKNGSKSKKCSLPSDGMTQKQWRERNGEIVSYNLTKPMKWKQFLALPEDVQQEYIATLQDKYDASMAGLAVMFETHVNTVRSYFKLHGIPAGNQHKRSRAQQALWRKFCWGENIPALVAKEDELVLTPPSGRRA